MTHTVPESIDAPEGWDKTVAETPLKLSKSDREAIERQVKVVADMMECWYEEARQANAEEDKIAERSMMRVMNTFTVAYNDLNAILWGKVTLSIPGQANPQ